LIINGMPIAATTQQLDLVGAIGKIGFVPPHNIRLRQ
jgi:hypothetical protein